MPHHASPEGLRGRVWLLGQRWLPGPVGLLQVGKAPHVRRSPGWASVLFWSTTAPLS